MPGDLGLALAEDLDEVADAHLPSIHEVQQPQTGAIGERRKEKCEVCVFGERLHDSIIYALTNVNGENIFVLAYIKESCPWVRIQRFRSR